MASKAAVKALGWEPHATLPYSIPPRVKIKIFMIINELKDRIWFLNIEILRLSHIKQGLTSIIPILVPRFHHNGVQKRDCKTAIVKSLVGSKPQ
jgi:hypothetical protein